MDSNLLIRQLHDVPRYLVNKYFQVKTMKYFQNPENIMRIYFIFLNMNILSGIYFLAGHPQYHHVSWYNAIIFQELVQFNSVHKYVIIQFDRRYVEYKQYSTSRAFSCIIGNTNVYFLLQIFFMLVIFVLAVVIVT